MRLNCGACVLLSAALLAAGCAAQSGASKEISPEELSKLLEQPGKVFFLDVREPAEIAQLGSVKGYINIPMSQLPRRLGEIPRDKLIVTL